MSSRQRCDANKRREKGHRRRLSICDVVMEEESVCVCVCVSIPIQSGGKRQREKRVWVCVSQSLDDDRTNDLLCHAWPWESSVDLGLHQPPGWMGACVCGGGSGGGGLSGRPWSCLFVSFHTADCQTAGSSTSPTGQVPLNPRRALILTDRRGESERAFGTLSSVCVCVRVCDGVADRQGDG